MDKAQRKAMVEQWKLRRPEMGVISIRCKEQQAGNWQEAGELEKLREQCLAEDEKAVKIWK